MQQHQPTSFPWRACGLALAIAACGGSGSGSGDPGDPGDDPDLDAGVDTEPPSPFAECAGDSNQSGFDEDPTCFDSADPQPDAPPLAAIEHELVTYEGTPAVHIALTLNPTFVDNTFGATAVGWNRHTFRDLVGSDHAQIVMLDAGGAVTFDVKVDYLSEDPDAPCGYASLGVSGGEGRVLVGEESAILAWRTSLDRNLNERGYCAFTTDSPASDEACTPDPAAPDWDFRVVYELWVAVSAFEPAGFGSAHLDFVHASPAKGGTNTLTVEPIDCPPGICNDPDGCDSGPGGTCSDTNPCPGGEFCYDGTCLPIVE